MALVGVHPDLPPILVRPVAQLVELAVAQTAEQPIAQAVADEAPGCQWQQAHVNCISSGGAGTAK